MKNFLQRLCKRDERGASLVEFALVVPVLLLLVMGILEFGWLFNGWITITASAREGARVAVVTKDLTDTGYIREAVERHTSIFESVSLDPAPHRIDMSQGGTGITVSVTGRIRPLVGFFVTGETVTLSGVSTMREE